MYKLRMTTKAEKKHETVVKNGFAPKLAEFLRVVKVDPYEDTPGHHYEALRENLKGLHSRRFNRANRFVYEVLPNKEGLLDKDGKLYDGIVRILSMWGHPY